MVVTARDVVGMPVADVPGLTLRSLQATDVEALGALIGRAYRATIDDDYEDFGEALGEAARTLAGHWGPLIGEASLAATMHGELVAAVVAVRDSAHDLIPLLAFVLTEPSWQRRGLASWLVAESLARAAALEIPQVHLAVARGNPAERVYQRLGFRSVD